MRPNIQAIELRQAEKIYQERVKESLSDFMGFAFEQMSKEYLEYLIQSDKISVYIKEYGVWWWNNPIERRLEEIDLVAIGDDEIIFCESKWRNQLLNRTVLKNF